MYRLAPTIDDVFAEGGAVSQTMCHIFFSNATDFKVIYPANGIYVV